MTLRVDILIWTVAALLWVVAIARCARAFAAGTRTRRPRGQLRRDRQPPIHGTITWPMPRRLYNAGCACDRCQWMKGIRHHCDPTWGHEDDCDC